MSGSLHRPTVLVLGASGMLGHTVLESLVADNKIHVIGTVRDSAIRSRLTKPAADSLLVGLDVLDSEQVRRCLKEVRPEVVVNCVGIIKQSAECAESARAVEINGVIPHRLADATLDIGARLVHVSTDCVFSGARGNYTEEDVPDPVDLYGRSKLVGEPNGEHVLTLRTSIIGHELGSNLSLVDWFLSQKGLVRGFTHAIYSGVTTFEFAQLLGRVIFEWPTLRGLYHVAAEPITKYDLLALIAGRYAWPGELVPSAEVVCDRSLSAKKLLDETGYTPPGWTQMVDAMYANRTWRTA